MFIGHFALSFAAKRAAPRVNLATLFAAAQLPDIIWPVLVAVGLEQVAIAPGDTAFTPLEFVSYPWSHSLVLVAVWGVIFAAVHRLRTRNGSASVLLVGLVVSHWLLDYLTHRPDLPIVPGGERFGRGLWNSVPLTLAVESLLFACGVWLYSQATRPRNERGRWGFVSLVAVLVLAYVGNIMAAPPSITAVWAGSMSGALLLLAWASYTDRNRTAA
jgi:membrane-bound metal-dependent hydrolase YbcI (DUF457 family)